MSCRLCCASLSPLSLSLPLSLWLLPHSPFWEQLSTVGPEINLCNYVTVTAAAPGTARDRVPLGEKERAGAGLSDRHQFGNRSAFCQCWQPATISKVCLSSHKRLRIN